VNKRTHWILYAAIVVLYLLHNDWWFWNDPRIVLGLPVGLTYHIGYNIAAAVLMFLLVRFAWPSHLEVIGEAGAGADLSDEATRGAKADSSAGAASAGEASGGER
jgi:hypothetical protein